MGEGGDISRDGGGERERVVKEERGEERKMLEMGCWEGRYTRESERKGRSINKMEGVGLQ